MVYFFAFFKHYIQIFILIIEYLMCFFHFAFHRFHPNPDFGFKLELQSRTQQGVCNQRTETLIGTLIPNQYPLSYSLFPLSLSPHRCIHHPHADMCTHTQLYLHLCLENFTFPLDVFRLLISKSFTHMSKCSVFHCFLSFTNSFNGVLMLSALAFEILFHFCL